MLVEILGVIKNIPVPNEAPPVESEYQFNMPALPVAPNDTLPVSQREPPVVLNTVGVILTVANIDVLEAVVQPLLVAST